jgi:ArsR family transcriptional regulator
MKMRVKNIREILKTCAEDTRLRIINLLENQELTVKVICQTLKISQSVVSKHLARLRHAKIVSDKRKGNMVYYRLSSNQDTFQYDVVKFLQRQCADIASLKEDKKSLAKAQK